MHLVGCKKLIQGALHGPLACPERQCKRRAQPALAIAEKREHMRVNFVRQRGQHHKITRGARAERKAIAARVDTGNSAEQLAQPTNLDAKLARAAIHPRASHRMRGREALPVMRQRAKPRQGVGARANVTGRVSSGINCPGREMTWRQASLASAPLMPEGSQHRRAGAISLAAYDHSSGRNVENLGCTFDLGCERCDAGLTCNGACPPPSRRGPPWCLAAALRRRY